MSKQFDKTKKLKIAFFAFTTVYLEKDVHTNWMLITEYKK